MRDPARIDRIINKLRKAWHEQPDSRLCQLIHNTVPAKITIDPFYLEDDRFEELLDARLDTSK